MAESHVTLVEVRKDGSVLHVHPTTVDAHVLAGWRIATDEPGPHVEPVDLGLNQTVEPVKPVVKPKRTRRPRREA